MSQQSNKKSDDKKMWMWGIGAVIVVFALFLVGDKMRNDLGQEDEGAGAKQPSQLEFVNTVETNGEALPRVTFEIEGYGTLVAELYPSIAPNTVNNFIELIQQGFYDGLTIHRIVPDFVVQGGDPMGNGMGGPGYSIKGEFALNGFGDNNLNHATGVLSMARRGDNSDTAGSQFFIVTKDAPNLNGNYAGFGKVIEGYDVLEQLNQVKPANAQSGSLAEPIVLTRLTVDTMGKTYPAAEKLNNQ